MAYNNSSPLRRVELDVQSSQPILMRLGNGCEVELEFSDEGYIILKGPILSVLATVQQYKPYSGDRFYDGSRPGEAIGYGDRDGPKELMVILSPSTDTGKSETSG